MLLLSIAGCSGGSDSGASPDPNLPPVASDQSITTAEDTPLGVTLAAQDADGDTLSYEILSLPAHGALTGEPPNLSYVGAVDFHGTDSFTFRARDATTASAPATVTITVTPVNDAPIAAGQALNVAEDQAAVIALTASDVDGDSLTYEVLTPPTHGTLMGTPPDVSYQGNAHFNGTDGFTYRASDGVSESAPATVNLTVTAVNDAPFAADLALDVAEDQVIAITLTGSDVDGDALTYEILTGPTSGTLMGTPPDISYQGNADFNGTDSFTYRANDGVSDSEPATVSLSVTAVNDAPVASEQTLNVAEDQLVAITLTGSDVDGDALSYEVLTGPANGTLMGTPPEISYQGNANFNGSDSFTYRANDASSDSAPAIVQLTISAVNDLPSASAQSLSVFGHDAISITLTGTDIDGDALSFEVVDAPTLGTLSGTPPNLSYTPDVPGSDQFTFRANDGSADSALATVSFTVTLPIGRAMLGPLGGAQVSLYHYPDLVTPAFSTSTSTAETLDRIGYFDLSQDGLVPDDLYLIVVSGGDDHDADDDGVLDDVPTPNTGTLHAVVTGAQIGEDLINVTAVSEIAYHRATYLMAAQFPKDQVLSELDARAPLILNEDLNGDGAIDRRDLTAWEPATGAASLRFDTNQLAALTTAIRDDTAELQDFLRLSDPILGELAVARPGSYVGMVGGYVVSAATGTGEPPALAVFDVSSAHQPQKVAELAISNANSYHFSGTRLYYSRFDLTTFSGIVGGVELSNPLQPTLINEIEAYPNSSQAGDVFVSGNWLYASDIQGVTRYSLASDGGIIGPDFATNSSANPGRIVATEDGTVVYVGSTSPLGIRVWDMAAPWSSHVVETDDFVDDLKIVGDRLWAAGGLALLEYDISTPSAPTLLATHPDYRGRLQVTAEQSLAVMQASDVVTLDISQPGQVTEVARVRLGLMRSLNTYYLAGPAIYGFADSGTFDSAVFFSADARHNLPRYLTSLVEAGQGIADIEAEGNLVYAAQPDGMAVFSVAGDGSSIERLSRTALPTAGIFRIGVLNSHVYLADPDEGLRVVDASDPTAPTEVSVTPLGVSPDDVYPLDVAVEGSTAYVVSVGAANFTTLDISSPSNPQILASIPLPENESLSPNPVTPVARDGYVYVADSRYGLRIVDASNPSAPQQVAGVLVPIVNGIAPFDVNLQGDLAYMAVSAYGLYVVDITDPAQPVTLSETPLFRAGTRFVPDGDVGYSLSGAGVIVLDLTDPAAPRPLYAIEAPGVDVERIGDVLATRSYGSMGLLPAVLQRVP